VASLRKTYRVLLSSARLFLKKPRLYGLNYIDAGAPAVFVSNHLGVAGPILLTLFLPFACMPWAISEITKSALCPAYLEREFLQPTFGLKPPWSGRVAAVIAPICVAIMKEAHAIPVYKGSRRIIETIDHSVRMLENGQNLLIFPEIGGGKDPQELAPFQTGFLRLGRAYYLKTQQCLDFYPLYVQKRPRLIAIGPSITYNPLAQYQVEKKRILNYLFDTIVAMSRPVT
jgi:hypothetical protein